MLIYLHATNQDPRSNHLGEMRKTKKGNFHSKSPLRGSVVVRSGGFEQGVEKE